MSTKPFLKWAGGKHRLLSRILPELPPGERLVEPFAGSAAVYLNAPFAKALVCDLNADLIDLFKTLRKEGAPFIRRCRALFSPENNSREGYERLRASFNALPPGPERAAILLYLNRHGYNGLIRYNSKGFLNVPFGSYKKPYFPERELNEFLRKTRECSTSFAVRDFRKTFAGLKAGDVVYCDPPYAPLSATASFTSYAGKSFSWQDQLDLAALAARAARKGIPVIISNHYTEGTAKLYPGAQIRLFAVPRFISCNGKKRDPAPEMLAVYA